MDDFVILHHNTTQLIKWKAEIDNFLKKELNIELHENKSKIIPLRSGISFLGYRIFYCYKLLKKSNLKKFEKSFKERLENYKIEKDEESYRYLISSMKGWSGYAIWADTYYLRRKLVKQLWRLK